MTFNVMAATSIDIVVVAPENDAVVLAEDFLAVVALYGPTAGVVERKQIQVYFDQEDITALCTITESYIRFVPTPSFMAQPGMQGKHFIAIVIVDSKGGVMREKTLDFKVVNTSQEYQRMQSNREIKLIQRGNVAVTYRLDELAGAGREEINTQVQWSAYQGKWGVRYAMNLTSDENPLQQPRNTFQLQTTYGRNVRIGLGDFYPNLHKFVAAGTRVRGVSFNAKLYNRGMQTLNLNVVYGLSRMGSDHWGFTARGIDEIGVYKRRTLIVSSKFGSGKRAQLGLILLKSKDDFGSITAEVNDAGQMLVGTTPKDNLVVGANFLLALWRRRVVFDANWAFGLYTDDTRNGPLTAAEATKFGVGNLPDLFERHQGKIIINSTSSFLIPTSAAFRNSSVYDIGLKIMTPSAWFDNFFDIRYKMLGPKYTSFAAPYIGSSRKGVQLTDRFRFFNKTVMMSGMIGLYENNVDELDAAATVFSNYGAALSWLPRNGLPTMRVQYNGGSSHNDNPDTSLQSESNNMSTGFSAGYQLATGSLDHSLNASLTQSGYSALSGAHMATPITSDTRTMGMNLKTNYGSSPLYTMLRYYTSKYTSTGSSQSETIGAGMGYRGAQQGFNGALHTGYTMYGANADARTDVQLTTSYTFSEGSTVSMNSGVRIYQEETGYRMDLRYNRLFASRK